ncbi:hypothetical protein D3C85_571350 [compost metagenome]
MAATDGSKVSSLRVRTPTIRSTTGSASGTKARPLPVAGRASTGSTVTPSPPTTLASSDARLDTTMAGSSMAPPSWRFFNVSKVALPIIRSAASAVHGTGPRRRASGWLFLQTSPKASRATGVKATSAVRGTWPATPTCTSPVKTSRCTSGDGSSMARMRMSGWLRA